LALFRVGRTSDRYAGARGLVPDTACVIRVVIHKNRIASPILVPFQARVRLHSDQRIAALIHIDPGKTFAVQETGMICRLR
jgi:hypothetical protein